MWIITPHFISPWCLAFVWGECNITVLLWPHVVFDRHFNRCLLIESGSLVFLWWAEKICGHWQAGPLIGWWLCLPLSMSQGSEAGGSYVTHRLFYLTLYCLFWRGSQYIMFHFLAPLPLVNLKKTWGHSTQLSHRLKWAGGEKCPLSLFGAQWSQLSPCLPPRWSMS